MQLNFDIVTSTVIVMQYVLNIYFLFKSVPISAQSKMCNIKLMHQLFKTVISCNLFFLFWSLSLAKDSNTLCNISKDWYLTNIFSDLWDLKLIWCLPHLQEPSHFLFPLILTHLRAHVLIESSHHSRTPPKMDFNNGWRRLIGKFVVHP